MSVNINPTKSQERNTPQYKPIPERKSEKRLLPSFVCVHNPKTVPISPILFFFLILMLKLRLKEDEEKNTGM